MPNPEKPVKARPYGGLAVQERREARRKKLIDAGYELFGTVGFSETKIEQVCALAGVGIRSLYDEFGSLEHLYRAVYDDVVDKAFSAVRSALQTSHAQTTSAMLSTGIGMYFHQMLDDRRSGRIVSIESARLDVFLGSHRNDTLKRFADLTNRLVKGKTQLDESSMVIWSTMLAGALNELVIAAVIAEDEPNVEQLAKSSTEIWIRSLGLPNESLNRGAPN